MSRVSETTLETLALIGVFEGPESPDSSILAKAFSISAFTENQWSPHSTDFKEKSSSGTLLTELTLEFVPQAPNKKIIVKAKIDFIIELDSGE